MKGASSAATLFIASALLSACGSSEEAQKMAIDAAVAKGANKELLEQGQFVYNRVCASCHGGNGEGRGSGIPPLHPSDYFSANLDRSIGHVINGAVGPMTVNGTNYDAMMPGMAHLSDANIAAVVSFISQAWNDSNAVSAEQVTQVRNNKS